jgi:TraY domain
MRNVTFRVTDVVYQKLVAAAKASGRSLNEELECRLSRTAIDDLRLAVEDSRIAAAALADTVRQ